MRTALVLTPLLVVAGCREANPPAADTSPPVTNAGAAASTTAPTGTLASAAPVASGDGAPEAGATPPAAADAAARTWSFDADKPDAPPSGFSFGRTGQGKEGRWVVASAADAPSKSNVLVQLDPDPTDYRFPVAVADASSFKDVKVSVRCKPISGRVDQGCGLVWRFQDANNYYLTRANALEDNVRLYHVKGGQRVQFASWSGRVSSGQWHGLRVEARGNRFEVYFDDKKILDEKDSTFSEAGKIGMWTKADSVIQFDDLSASPL